MLPTAWLKNILTNNAKHLGLISSTWDIDLGYDKPWNRHCPLDYTNCRTFLPRITYWEMDKIHWIESDYGISVFMFDNDIHVVEKIHNVFNVNFLAIEMSACDFHYVILNVFFDESRYFRCSITLTNTNPLLSLISCPYCLYYPFWSYEGIQAVQMFWNTWHGKTKSHRLDGMCPRAISQGN